MKNMFFRIRYNQVSGSEIRCYFPDILYRYCRISVKIRLDGRKPRKKENTERTLFQHCEYHDKSREPQNF